MERFSNSVSNVYSRSSDKGAAVQVELQLNRDGGGRQCELCREELATVYCAADEAELCWECDVRIHSANFLVARHPRVFLCLSCGTILHPAAASSAPASSASFMQHLCHACSSGIAGGRWLDSDEESRIQDDSDSAAHNDASDDDNDVQLCPDPLDGHFWHSRQKVEMAFSCAPRINSCEPERWGISTISCEEGMGDSQEQELIW